MTDNRYRLSAGGWLYSRKQGGGRWSDFRQLYSRKQGGACGARVLWSERFPTRRSRHHHHPLNLLNPVNPLNPHTEGVSNAARRHRHLERRIYEKIFSRCFILPPA